jgi:hypothetical protein
MMQCVSTLETWLKLNTSHFTDVHLAMNENHMQFAIACHAIQRGTRLHGCAPQGVPIPIEKCVPSKPELNDVQQSYGC